jgi:CDP-diacylglycerol---serine O-phosphatidyltransferase
LAMRLQLQFLLPAIIERKSNYMISDSKRFAYFLPNIFTALNMGCGFASITQSIQHNFYLASILLLLGAVFDSVDGRVARLTGTQSQFGEQFDSISDVVSFGVAPSILVYQCFFLDWGRSGLVLSFVFLLCGALRLARFNANIEKVSSNYFQGMPIPGAALALVGLVLGFLEFGSLLGHPFVTIPYVLVFSLLMISNIPFPSFKDSDFVRKHMKTCLAIILALFVLLVLYEELMLGLIVNGYVISSVVYFLLHKGDFQDIFLWKDDDN